MSVANDETGPIGGGDDVRAVAQGWHRIQLAALGFIGLCGVLQSRGGPANPRWLEVLAGLLVLCALVLSGMAIAMVAMVAWPVAEPSGVGSGDAARSRRRLRTGVRMTFVAVAVLALATTSSWWPRDSAEQGQVRVTTSSGIVCGELAEADAGVLVIKVNEQRVQLALHDVARLQPVDSCE